MAGYSTPRARLLPQIAHGEGWGRGGGREGVLLGGRVDGVLPVLHSFSLSLSGLEWRRFHHANRPPGPLTPLWALHDI